MWTINPLCEWGCWRAGTAESSVDAAGMNNDKAGFNCQLIGRITRIKSCQ